MFKRIKDHLWIQPKEEHPLSDVESAKVPSSGENDSSETSFMTCPQCGAIRTPEYKFCTKCGLRYEEAKPPGVSQHGVATPYQSPPQYPVPPVMPAKKNDGSCVASLVLGILAWIVPFAGILFAVLAIIFGATGVRKVDRNPHYLTGKGLGTAGLILGITGLAVSIVVVSIAVPVFFSARSSAQEKTCQANMRMIISASNIYAAANNGEYPTSMDDLVPDYLEEELRCPEDNSRYIIEWSPYSPPEISCPNHGSL
ncbi:MAG: DUF4190 domain-containing protein [Actinobacteria bacterium]|nr:DUF4190 domain-containing protein [Actinomycetota bacterium]